MQPNNIVDFVKNDKLQTSKSPFKNLAEHVDLEAYTEDRGVEILSIALDLGNGDTASFTIHENDYPDKIAQGVCTKYGLEQDYQQKLTSYILDKIDEIVMENYETAPEDLDITPEYQPAPQTKHQNRVPTLPNYNHTHSGRHPSQTSPSTHSSGSHSGNKRHPRENEDDEYEGANADDHIHPTYSSKHNSSAKKTSSMKQGGAPKQAQQLQSQVSLVGSSKLRDYKSQSNPLLSNNDSLDWKHELQLLRKNEQLQVLSRDLEESRLCNANVYEKLYKQGNIKSKIKNEVHNTVEHQKYKTDDEMNKWKSSVQSMDALNVGNRLYTLGKRRIEIREFNVKQKQDEQLKSELEQCEFRPNLALTEQSNSRLLKPKPQQALDRLVNSKKLKNVKDNGAFEPHSFKPEINKTSKIIMKRTQEEINRQIGREENAPFDRHEQLYYDAIQRQKKQTEINNNFLSDEYTFKPSVNYSKVLLKSEDPGFFERLHVHSKKKEIYATGENDVDEVTGQKLFHPKINNYNLNRNLANVDIGEYLYSRQELIEMNRSERIKMTEKEAEELVSSKKVNKLSENMFERKKLRKFEDIFHALDGDQDGYISADKIDIASLNPDVLAVIKVLLFELEEKGKTLDLQSFSQAMSRFYEWLTPSDRQKLLGAKTLLEPPKVEPKVEHRPKINEFSQHIVDNLKKRNDGLDNIKKKWEERKKEYQKINQQKDEEQTGTRGPLINKPIQSNLKNSNISDIYSKLRMNNYN